MAAQQFYIYLNNTNNLQTLEEIKSRDNGRMETQASFHHPLTDLPVVTELIAGLLALMERMRNCRLYFSRIFPVTSGPK